jgi:hypothetical protein
MGIVAQASSLWKLMGKDKPLRERGRVRVKSVSLTAFFRHFPPVLASRRRSPEQGFYERGDAFHDQKRKTENGKRKTVFS